MKILNKRPSLKRKISKRKRQHRSKPQIKTLRTSQRMLCNKWKKNSKSKSVSLKKSMRSTRTKCMKRGIRHQERLLLKSRLWRKAIRRDTQDHSLMHMGVNLLNLDPRDQCRTELCLKNVKARTLVLANQPTLSLSLKPPSLLNLITEPLSLNSSLQKAQLPPQLSEIKVLQP